MLDQQDLKNADQKTVLKELLKQDKRVLVIVDATKPEVVLPKYLMGSAHVRLKLSRNFAQPIELTSTEVKTTLSFNGKPFEVCVPYNTIYGLADIENVGDDLEFVYDFKDSFPIGVMKELEDFLDNIREPEEVPQAPRRLLKKK